MLRSSARKGKGVCVHEPHINFINIPESCISTILSLTTQRDVSRLAAVCKLFRSAAYSDSVWNKFLPRQCYEILPRAAKPIQFNSKRELYFRLCDSILIDKGTKIFWLERSTAKIGYMLSAGTLGIYCGKAHEGFWSWRLAYNDDSRFHEVLELLFVQVFDTGGGLDCRLLSADTEYRVVFVLKLRAYSNGFHGRPVKFSVRAPGAEEMELEHLLPGDKRVYCKRGTRWIEVVAGEFTMRAAEDMDDVFSHIEFRMKEVEALNWKVGLQVDGVKIEPRPS